MWSARRQRRNRPQTYEFEKLPRVRLFSKTQFQDITTSAQKIISFLIGPLFILGSALFIVGGMRCAICLPSPFLEWNCMPAGVFTC